MLQVTTAEAQERLPELFVIAEAGNAVKINAHHGRTFTLVANPLRPKRIPKTGSMKGLIRRTVQ